MFCIAVGGWHQNLLTEFINRQKSFLRAVQIATLSTWKNQTFIISISETSNFFYFPHLFSCLLISVSSPVVINMERAGKSKKVRTEKRADSCLYHHICVISTSKVVFVVIVDCAERLSCVWCLFASFDRCEMIVTDLTIDNCRQNSQPQQP